MTKRRNFSDEFKATVALEALRGDMTVQEIASKRQLHPTQVSTWKRQVIEGMANVFSEKLKLLKISRSLVYYTSVGFDQATIDLMHEIDRIFTKYPFFGSRKIAAYLPQSGFSAGRYRLRRLMA